MVIPFVNELPYLHFLTFWQRVNCYFLLFSISYLFIKWGARPENKKAATEVVSDIKNQVAKWLGFCLFIFGGADSHANIMGLLVIYTLPTQPYLEEMRIDKVKFQGSKSKSIYLTLHSETSGKTYYLTLAEKLFIYPRFEAGDKMILKGQQNIFGVYVEKFDLGPV